MLMGAVRSTHAKSWHMGSSRLQGRKCWKRPKETIDFELESPPPPSQPLLKQLKMDESGKSGVGDMAKAILGFTKAYEKAETAKVKLMLKLRKEKMKFVKDMEL
ncbi:hypothetical protein Bca4012_063671 [Brassica carinata]